MGYDLKRNLTGESVIDMPKPKSNNSSTIGLLNPDIVECLFVVDCKDLDSQTIERLNKKKCIAA